MALFYYWYIRMEKIKDRQDALDFFEHVSLPKEDEKMQEIIMSQKLPDLQEKITVDHIDLIAVLLGFFPKIVHIILQNPKDRISRI